MRQSKRMTMVLALLLSVVGADVFAQKGGGFGLGRSL